MEEKKYELRYKDGSPMRKYNSPKLQAIEMKDKQITAVEWLSEKLWKEFGFFFSDNILQEAKEIEKEKMKENLIGFQIYLHDKGLINNHEWDWEKLAKQYIKKEYK